MNAQLFTRFKKVLKYLEDICVDRFECDTLRASERHVCKNSLKKPPNRVRRSSF